MTQLQLGGQAFNHQQGSGAEAEYDRLRSLARAAHDPRSREQYNNQARDFIFRENNAVGRVDSDTIDLHGLYVHEAEEIIEQRIRYAQSTGQTHLHVIVGKGNHSTNHIQKLKPKVEEICREMGLQYSTEHNAGRIYVNLQGGSGAMPSHLISDHNAYQVHQPQQHAHQNQYGGQHQGRPHYQNQHQNQNQQDEVEQTVKACLPILRKLVRSCCVIM
ncbi:MAG: hypothetical protein Q9170_005820 [Blastenia crenularia]